VALVQLQPGLRLADLQRFRALPTLRARTAREASASEGRRSPLNAIVVWLLAVFAIALLPLWRPVGPAGVPVAAVSYAPQGIAHKLEALVHGGQLSRNGRVWAPQAWGSFLEWAAPDVRVAVDSRIELFPPPVLQDADEIAAGASGWLSTLEVRRVDALVLDAGSVHPAALTELGSSPSWKRVYSDDDGSIWLRAG
jgi:hypothetical protein